MLIFVTRKHKNGKEKRPNRRTVEKKSRRVLRIERPENRNMLSGISILPVPSTGITVTTEPLQSGSVTPGQNGVEACKLQVSTNDYAGDRIDAVQFTIQGAADIAHLHVFETWGMVSHKVEVTPQAYLDGNRLELEFASYAEPSVSRFMPLTLEVDADIAPAAHAADKVGLGDVTVAATQNSWWFWWNEGNPAPVHYAGAANPTYTVSNPIPMQADLSASLSGPSTVQQGDLLSYHMTAHNSGPATATGVLEQMPVPVGATLDVAHSTPGVTTALNGQMVAWHEGNLVSGSSASATVAFDTDHLRPGTISERAVVTSNVSDPNPANNISNLVFTEITQPPKADLSASLVASAGQVHQGDTLTYTLYARDLGPAGAQGVVETFPLSSGLQLISSSGSQGTYANGIWTVGSLADWQTATLHVVCSVVAPSGTITETVRVSAQTPDPNPLNNSASSVVSVLPKEADLSVMLTTNASTVTQGGSLIYTVIAHNSGPGSAQNVVAPFALSSGLQYVSSSGTQGHYANGIWMVGTLADGQTAKLTVLCTVTAASGMLTETATVTSSTPDGNSQNNTASSIVTVVPQGTLAVAEQSIGSSDTAVKNQKDITVSRFVAYGNIDELLTSATFTALQGNLLDGQNFALWVDTDGDGKVDTMLQKGISALNGVVTADNLFGGGYVVPAQKEVAFELHMDVASSLSTNVLQVGLSSAQAETVNDGAASQVNLTHSTAKVWNFVSEGSLFVSADTMPRSHQLLAGAVGNEVMQLAFRAQNEDVAVTTLRLLVVGNGAQSIDSLLLYKAGETTPFAIMTAAATGADVVPTTYGGQPAVAFTARMLNQQLVVPNGQTKIVGVVPRLKSDADGAQSGTTFTLVLYKDNVLNDSTGEGAVHAVGVESGNNLVGNNGGDASSGAVFIGTNDPGPNTDVVSPTQTVVLSKIVSIVNADPDPDGTAVPVGVSPIGEFFTAAANSNTLNGLNKAVLDSLTFTVNATNVAIDPASFALINKIDASVKVAPSSVVQTSPGVYKIVFTGLAASAVDTRIGSGTSETFALEGNITNPKTTTSSSSLQASLDVGSIVYLDSDAGGQTPITGDDIGSTVVKSTLYVS